MKRWSPVGSRGFIARIGLWEAFVVERGYRDFQWNVYPINSAGQSNADKSPTRHGLTPTLIGAKRCAWLALVAEAGRTRPETAVDRQIREFENEHPVAMAKARAWVARQQRKAGAR